MGRVVYRFETQCITAEEDGHVLLCQYKPIDHLLLNGVSIVCFANCLTLTSGMRFGACLGVESSFVL